MKKITRKKLEEIVEASLSKFLTKPLFAKPPPTPEQERLKAEGRAQSTFDDIANMIEEAPRDLSGMIKTLRDIKEKLSQVLIWGKDPLLDIIKEETDQDDEADI